MTRPLIGISGFAGAGKTEAARYIEHTYDYERQHIAEPLRRMLGVLLRDFDMPWSTIDRYLVGDLKEQVIDVLGATSRRCQVTLGTEWGRKLVHPDLWTRLWLHRAERVQASGRGVMNDSVRFPNEERAVRSRGGFTLLIVRPGCGPAVYKWKVVGPLLYRWFGILWGVHDSERVDRLHPDEIIVNDGSIADLHRKIEEILPVAMLKDTT